MNLYRRPVWAEVDLGILKENIRSIRETAGGRRIISVVKADAYGHGMKEVAGAIKDTGVRDFAVAILAEALELRTSDPDSSIMILGYTPGEMAFWVIENELTATVFTVAEARKFQMEAQRLGKKVKLAVAIDTGMSRIGFPSNDDSVQAIQEISEMPDVILEELFTHFSTADETDKTYSRLQISRYEGMKAKLDQSGVRFNHYHMANSAAISDLPEAHFDTVRPGIIQYGYYPSNETRRDELSIRPILSWYANIALVKEIQEGTPVSYGNTWTAPKKSLIATIPMGYADGVNRLLSNKGKVLVGGREAPIRGRVCMDQFMVDVTEIEGVKAGDRVTFIGADGDLNWWADAMASELGTISYEILCDVGVRVPRVYRP